MFVLLAIWALRDALLLAFAAILIACVLRVASSFVGAITGIGPQWALAPIMLALVGVAGGLLWWRGPEVAAQTADLAVQLRRQAQELWGSVSVTGWGSSLLDQIRGSAAPSLHGLGGTVAGLAGSTLGVGGSLLLVLATALFLAISPEPYRGGLLRLAPPAWRDRGEKVLVAIGETLQLWFVGQLIDMVLVSVLIGTVSLPPALSIFSQTILGSLFGPLGLILATPVMAASLTLVRMAYVESVIERPESETDRAEPGSRETKP